LLSFFNFGGFSEDCVQVLGAFDAMGHTNVHALVQDDSLMGNGDLEDEDITEEVR